MADDLIVRDGQIMRRNQRTGAFVPATEQELDVIQAGVRGKVASFAEGLLPVVAIGEAIGAFDEGFSEALKNVNPVSTLAGQATVLGSAMTGAFQLMRGGLGMVRGLTGQAPRSTRASERLTRIQQVADEGPIPVARDPGELIPGVTGTAGQNIVAGGRAMLSSIVEQSKILSRAVPGLSPNLSRQIANQAAGIRGTTLTMRDLGRTGRLTRKMLGRDKRNVDKLYAKVMRREAKDVVMTMRKQQDELLKAIKSAPAAERALIRDIFGQELKTGQITQGQILQRHRDLRALAAKTDNQLTRDAINKSIDVLEELMRESEDISITALRFADEKWRFHQVLENSFGKHGQLDFNRVISNAERMFGREFAQGELGRAGVRGSGLTQEGKDAIRTWIKIEDAGGVQLPEKAISAIDWATGLGFLIGSTGGGVF